MSNDGPRWAGIISSLLISAIIYVSLIAGVVLLVKAAF